MSQLNLTAADEKTLRTTEIGDSAPGPIVHDFQVMLDFVAETTPFLTKKHMLTLRALEPLNERLSRRIDHGLARPQQKSFPHINGLFLLLRASGLTRVCSDIGLMKAKGSPPSSIQRGTERVLQR